MLKFRALWIRSSGKWFIECPRKGCFDVMYAKRGDILPHDRAIAHLKKRHRDG